MSKKIELLAPGGSKESLIAAVEGGADAVYIGGSSFSARAGAQNFTNDEMEWAVDYCHLRCVKVYVAINTLVSDREFGELAEFIAFVNNIGADAVIVQDLGVAVLAREVAPELSLHISTQATVYDTDGALYFEKLGFKRAVLARELSMQKIAKIASNVNIETEIFVHGAICVCYSGQCLMSSVIGGRSGNRGKCAQPCRLPYKIDNNEGFLLSPKDMCLIKHLNDLKKIGVTSLKIEGRMKGSEYVGTVCNIYRKYIDNGSNVSDEDYKRLERIFYRGGFTAGYFTGKKGYDMFCYTKPDNPYKKQSNDNFNYNINRKTKINIDCVASFGKPLEINISDLLGNSVRSYGSVNAEKAINKPLTHERLKEQLSKLGDTVFSAESITTEIDDNISLPVSEINSVRRSASALLENKIIQSYKRADAKKAVHESGHRKASKMLKTAVQISDINQLNGLCDSDYDYIYVPLEIAVKLNDFTDKMIVALPRLTTENIKETLEKLSIKKALMTNIGQAIILQDLGYEIVVDHSLNIFNTKAAKHFSYAKRITLSTELMLSQIRSITCETPIEAVAYGRLSLMIMENCIIKSATECKKAQTVTDRTGTEFPVRCLPDCRNEILNSKPIVMSDKLGDIMQSGIDVIRLIFTVESPEECKSVINQYKMGLKPKVDFTRGKFYKGV